jgi:aspartyl-tRNA synthetase
MLSSVYRSHTCGELTISNSGDAVKLAGWVHNIRDHGAVLFFDLRDNYGITQIVFEPSEKAFEIAAQLGKEYIIAIAGKVQKRLNPNENLATGQIEVLASTVEILSKPMAPLPFSIFPAASVAEDHRLKHRFLDLRRNALHKNILLRSNVIQTIRERMHHLGFTEFQTPILTASSPEGARDFLVPSRLYPGKFFALPQAPQQFKQLFMVAGFDRYFQIAPCFRDEDARADRSPGEFYQLDLEMSFATQEDVFEVVEDVFLHVFKTHSSWDIPPFIKITYDDAMARYGTDKPDLRIPLEIQDVSRAFISSDFRAFSGKSVKVLALPGCSEKPRSFFDKALKEIKQLTTQPIAWMTVDNEGKQRGQIAKYITDVQAAEINKISGYQSDVAYFFSAAESPLESSKAMGKLRVMLGNQLGLVEKGTFRFCWIVDYPMFEINDSGEIDFSHNPFSMPQGGLAAIESMDPLEIKAYQYDIVCNGYELSSGAVRNHLPEIMYKAFAIVGYTKDAVDSEFRGMINALKFGAPPHAGIAPGIDRIVMLIADEPNIREVIAFPLNQKAQDLMMNAPSTIPSKQLNDVHISINLPDEISS